MRDLGIITGLLAALSLSACNEPARPDGFFSVTMEGPDGTSWRETYEPAFALLEGCGDAQRLQLDATGRPSRASLTIALNGDQAELETAAFRADEFGYQTAFNGWFAAPEGEVLRQDLGGNQQVITIMASAKGEGLFSGSLDRMPDVTIRVNGVFEKIARYEFGGKVPCPGA